MLFNSSQLKLKNSLVKYCSLCVMLCAPPAPDKSAFTPNIPQAARGSANDRDQPKVAKVECCVDDPEAKGAVSLGCGTAH